MPRGFPNRPVRREVLGYFFLGHDDDHTLTFLWCSSDVSRVYLGPKCLSVLLFPLSLLGHLGAFPVGVIVVVVVVLVAHLGGRGLGPHPFVTPFTGLNPLIVTPSTHQQDHRLHPVLGVQQDHSVLVMVGHHLLPLHPPQVGVEL